MSRFYSPKEVAKGIGVSESSLKRWVDKGLIEATKTAGGHRRIYLDSVLAYVRKTGRPIASPTSVGLPENCGRNADLTPAEACAALESCLTNGDEAGASTVVLDLYIAGLSIAEICDSVITPTFHSVGDLWECGELEVYEERRACEICQRVVHELRRAVGDAESNGPTAIGGTLDGDPYTLATSLAELVLRSNGWQAMSLGNMLPFDSIRKAVMEQRPEILWLSVTSIRDPDRFTGEFNLTFDAAQSVDTAVVVGGQALSADLRRNIRYTHFADNFQHMESFIRTVRPRPRQNSESAMV